MCCCSEATEKVGEGRGHREGQRYTATGTGEGNTGMSKAAEQGHADAARAQSWRRDRSKRRSMVVKGRWGGESPTPRREEQQRCCPEGRGQSRTWMQ